MSNIIDLEIIRQLIAIEDLNKSCDDCDKILNEMVKLQIFLWREEHGLKAIKK